MDFALSANQQSIRDAVKKVCARFDDGYWLKKDKEGGFPADFHKALADAGWLGICIPEAYGGSGLGIVDAAIMMRTIAESGAGMSGASAIHMNVFGLNPVVVFGTQEQCQRMLPPIVNGTEKACFAVTEPNTGLNTTQLKTRAVRSGNKYVVNGQKVWISSAQVAEKILLLARTTPLEEVKSPTHGLSLFYTDFDRSRIAVHEIEKMGRKPVDSNELFIEDFEIPVGDRLGEEGRGFEYILHGMNPEHPDRCGSGGARQGGAVACGGVRQREKRLQSADRQKPGDTTSPGEELDGVGGGVVDDALGRLGVRSGNAVRPGRERRKISRGGSRLPRVRAGGNDARRLRLCQGVSRRALFAGIIDPPHRPDQSATHTQLYRGKGAGPSEVVLGFGG